jgi:hypothetical protein
MLLMKGQRLVSQNVLIYVHLCLRKRRTMSQADSADDKVGQEELYVRDYLSYG